MSDYQAIITWERHGALFTDNRYSREHRWLFDEGVSVAASASPHIVPLPYSSAAAVDPEEAFVAALSSCHMLFFLSLVGQAALRRGLLPGCCGRGDGEQRRREAGHAGGDAPAGGALRG